MKQAKTCKRVAIIGAGIGGIATANILAKAGYEVHVYEQHAAPGGRAGQLKRDGFTFDTGPSWYLMPEVFDHYYSLLGLSVHERLDLTKLDPSYKVYFESDPPVVVRADLADAQRVFEDIEPGAGRQLGIYAAKCKQIYDASLKHFLYTNARSIRDVVHPEVILRGPRLLYMALTSVDSYIRLYFRNKRIRQILEYTMVFLGASPYKAPAIYTLMSAVDFYSGVYYPRGGMYALIEDLVRIGEEMGVKYHYNSAVTRIETRAGNAVGIQLASGEVVSYDVVISNADQYFTETKLLSRHEQTYPEKYWKSRTAGPSAILMYLGVQGELPELEHHSLCFVDDWRGNFQAIYETKSVPERASIYVSRASATEPESAPKGCESLVVLVPLPSGVSMGREALDAHADRYLHQLAEMIRVPDLPGRIVSRTVVGPDDFGSQYHAWQNTALGPSHTLRQTAWFRTHNKSRKVDNLYYVGAFTIPGIGVPMCVIGAELLYKHLAGITTGGPINHVDNIGGL